MSHFLNIWLRQGLLMAKPYFIFQRTGTFISSGSSVYEEQLSCACLLITQSGISVLWFHGKDDITWQGQYLHLKFYYPSQSFDSPRYHVGKQAIMRHEFNIYADETETLSECLHRRSRHVTRSTKDGVWLNSVSGWGSDWEIKSFGTNTVCNAQLAHLQAYERNFFNNSSLTLTTNH